MRGGPGEPGGYSRAGTATRCHGEGNDRALRRTTSRQQDFPQASWKLVAVGNVSMRIRDGMNLVAMEYLASRRPDDPGVPAPSRFAGAARRLPYRPRPSTASTHPMRAAR